MSHIVSGCSKLAQQEYKRRHDNVAWAVHWDLLGKCGFSRVDKWFEHQQETVFENNDYKLLWDYNIQTNHQQARIDMPSNRHSSPIRHSCKGQARIKAREIPGPSKRDTENVECPNPGASSSNWGTGNSSKKA